MKVTFDSNVWRIISSPDKFPKEQSIDEFIAIRKAIDEKQVTAFMCETVFTLEAIQKKDRKDFFSDYKPSIDFSEEVEGSEIKLSFSIGSDNSAHPGNNSFLEQHLKDAIAVGFQLIKLPRISGVINPDIEKHFYKHVDLGAYHDKVFSISEEIELKKAGMFHIMELGEKYDDHWIAGIEGAPEYEKGNIAKAIAEWADGDSVACHIAVGGDYFCTRDTAKKAGDRSIFSEVNLEWLKKAHDFQIISPEELARKCRNT